MNLRKILLSHLHVHRAVCKWFTLLDYLTRLAVDYTYVTERFVMISTKSELASGSSNSGGKDMRR